FASLPRETDDAPFQTMVRVARRIGEFCERRRSQRALFQSEELLRDIADNAREVFFTVSADGEELLYASAAFHSIWGRPCDEALGFPGAFLAFAHPDDRASLEHDRARLLADAVEYRIVRPDGATRWIRSRGFPIRDEQGHIARYAG